MSGSTINDLVATMRADLKEREDALNRRASEAFTSDDLKELAELEKDMYEQADADLKALLRVLEHEACILEPLTVQDVIALNMFWPFLEGHKRIKWVDNPGDDILRGVVRHLVKDFDNIGFLGPGQDIRTSWVRITTVTGGELRRPLMQFARLIPMGCLAEDD